MTHADFALTALALWREARGEGVDGMTAVACVIRNRAAKPGTTPFAEVTKKLAFSSITAPGDPELTLYPSDNDVRWQQAQQIAADVLNGFKADTTGGSTLYYAPAAIHPTQPYTLPDGTATVFPHSWNPAAVVFQEQVGKQLFFSEK